VLLEPNDHLNRKLEAPPNLNGDGGFADHRGAGVVAGSPAGIWWWLVLGSIWALSDSNRTQVFSRHDLADERILGVLNVSVHLKRCSRF
jgi:hypothetical protein